MASDIREPNVQSRFQEEALTVPEKPYGEFTPEENEHVYDILDRYHGLKGVLPTLAKRMGITAMGLRKRHAARALGPRKRGRKPQLPVEVEAAVAQWVCDHADRGTPVGVKALTTKVKQIALKLGLHDKEYGNKGWREGFYKRFPPVAMCVAHVPTGGAVRNIPAEQLRAADGMLDLIDPPVVPGSDATDDELEAGAVQQEPAEAPAFPTGESLTRLLQEVLQPLPAREASNGRAGAAAGEPHSPSAMHAAAGAALDDSHLLVQAAEYASEPDGHGASRLYQHTWPHRANSAADLPDDRDRERFREEESLVDLMAAYEHPAAGAAASTPSGLSAPGSTRKRARRAQPVDEPVYEEGADLAPE